MATRWSSRTPHRAWAILAFAAACGAPCDAAHQRPFFLDLDSDGFNGATPVYACVAPVGAGDPGPDCDDRDAATHPGALETCDGQDDDCDGVIDGAAAAGQRTFWRDGDRDGVGVAALSISACEAPDGFAATLGDCDDADPARHPGAIDGCDGVDDDCSGVVDDGPQPTWYVDADGDGYGDPYRVFVGCLAPEGYVSRARDCDDTRADVQPGVIERCNGLDDDCDGVVDPDTSAGAPTWYVDGDGDGFAAADADVFRACDPPDGAAALGDCDDADPARYPANPEVCDGVDNDCDGEIDWDLAVPDQQPSIEVALIHAEDGDTICLAPGTYVGAFDSFGTSVVIQGAGRDVTALDGGGAGPVWTVATGETVTLRDLTVTGGVSDAGAAVYVDDATIVAERVRFTGLEVRPAASGTKAVGYGPVYLWLAEARFEDVVFEDLDVSPGVGHLGLTYGPRHELYGGLVYLGGSNLTWDGGAIARITVSPSHDGGAAAITGSTHVYGALVYAYVSDVAMTGVDWTDLTVAPTPPATASSGGDVVELQGLAYVSYSGFDVSDAAITDVDVTASAAAAPRGGVNVPGVILYGVSGRPTFEAVEVTRITATAAGGTTGGATVGGLWGGSGTARFERVWWTDAAISGTTLSLMTWTGAVAADTWVVRDHTLTSTSPASSCRGLYLVDAGTSVAFSRVAVAANTLDCATAGPWWTVYGFRSGGTATATNLLLAGNTITATSSASSGIVYAYYSDLTLTNAVIADNTVSAALFTGKLYGAVTVDAQSDLVATNVSIDHNTWTAPTASSGGAVVVMASTATATATYANWLANSGSSVWLVNGSATSPVGSDGNISVDPGYTDGLSLDYTLGAGSALIDAGSPDWLDADGTTSDIGAFGGPGGSGW